MLRKIREYDIIISPKSSSKLLNLLCKKLKDRGGNNVLMASDLIVKNSIENIIIDDSYFKNDTSKGIIKNCMVDGVFNMKKVPPKFRKLISNYLKFSDDTQRTIYNAINGGKVLIVDDIFVSG